MSEQVDGDSLPLLCSNIAEDSEGTVSAAGWRGDRRMGRCAFAIFTLLRPEPLQEIAAWIAQIEAQWDARLDALHQHLMQQERKNQP